MAIGIYSNLFKDSDKSVTNALINILRKNNIDFYLNQEVKDEFINEKFYDQNIFPTLEMLLTVGGDGTIIMVGLKCMQAGIPILGINKGTKGFLNEIELSDLESIISIIKEHKYKIDKRGVICAEYLGVTYYALNEAIVNRSDTKMISVDVDIEGQLVDKYSCDGFIVCTPTGSTAYSLSAGGPVISPTTNAMCLTAINSHCLHTRPIVISGDETVGITVYKAYEDATLIVDGVEAVKIKINDKVKFYMSDKSLDFIRLPNSNFYSKLLTKLNGSLIKE